MSTETAIRVKRAEKFKPLYELPPGTNIVICIGGRGGMKTYEVSKYAAFQATIKKRRIAVLRDERETIRESILNEIFLRYDTANQHGHFNGLYEKNERGIRDLTTGEMLVFTKGFRASSTQKTANLKSISDVDIAIIEEAEDIRDPIKFNTFADSIRKEDSLIIVVLNTPDINHWLIKRYFTTEQVKDGYYRIIPKEIPGFVCIQTSYLDNPHLPEHIVRQYTDYGNPESHLYDEHYYLTAILGYASTGRRGQILTKAKPISLKDYLALPYREIYGQDFGTASPAGLVGVKIHRNQVFARELNYKPLDTLEIAKLYCRLGFDRSDKIVADSAEPKTIAKLRNGYRGSELADEVFEQYPELSNGFRVVGARKGSDSVEYGIGLLKSMELHIVEESTNFWNEVHNYVYDQDKNGNYTNDPIDDFNHLIDPLRYVVMDAKQGGGGPSDVPG